MVLKDFAYIDFERVRSYVAQFDGRLTESLTGASTHQGGAKGKMKSGGLVKLLVDAEAEGSYLYTRSNTETASLHHAIFDIFEGKAKTQNLIGDLNDSSTPFASVGCHIQVTDYGLMAKQFKATSKLMPLMARLASGSTTSNAKSQLQQIKDVTEAVELLYGNHRIVHLLDDNGKTLAQASFNTQLLDESSLFLSDNNIPLPEIWQVFALKLRGAEKPELPKHITGNPMSDALQNVSSAFWKMRTEIFGDRPQVAIIPIAIYRKLS